MPGDRPQAPPRGHRVVGQQVGAARGDLGGGAPQRERRGTARGRAPRAAPAPWRRRRPRRGGVAQAGLRAAAPEQRRSGAAGWRPRARTRSAARVTAATSVSHGSGSRRTRNSGWASTHRAADHLDRRDGASWNGRRSSSMPVAKPAAGSPHIGCRFLEKARAANRVLLSGSALHDGHVHGRRAPVEKPLETRARAGAAGRRPSPPRRRNSHGGRTSTRTSATGPRVAPAPATSRRPRLSRGAGHRAT